MNKNQAVSFRMALIMGIFLPFAETVRRFHQLADIAQFFHWFDDYLLGAILLIAAIKVKKNQSNADQWMIGAWGIGVGALFMSLLGQIDYIMIDHSDPGGVFSVWFVLVAKMLILGYIIFGLIKSIEASKS